MRRHWGTFAKKDATPTPELSAKWDELTADWSSEDKHRRVIDLAFALDQGHAVGSLYRSHTKRLKSDADRAIAERQLGAIRSRMLAIHLSAIPSEVGKTSKGWRVAAFAILVMSLALGLVLLFRLQSAIREKRNRQLDLPAPSAAPPSPDELRLRNPNFAPTIDRRGPAPVRDPVRDRPGGPTLPSSGGASGTRPSALPSGSNAQTPTDAPLKAAQENPSDGIQ